MSSHMTYAYGVVNNEVRQSHDYAYGVAEAVTWLLLLSNDVIGNGLYTFIFGHFLTFDSPWLTNSCYTISGLEIRYGEPLHIELITEA